MVKKLFIIFLLALLLFTCGCFGKAETTYRIDVTTEELSAYVGEYVSPFYNVVNEAGEVINEYEVVLQSVVDSGSNKVNVNEDKRTVLITKAGLYTFTYGVEKTNIPNAEVKVRFSHVPPTINIDEYAIPFVYHKGLTYELPQYSFSADAVADKSYFAIYHEGEDGQKKQVEFSGNKFIPAQDKGKYELVFHAEGALDNVQEKVFEIDAGIGPNEIIEGKVGCFDEEFGQYQFESKNAKVFYSKDFHYGDETGSTGFEMTYNDTRFANLVLPVQKDVSEYDYLELYIYNDNDYDLGFVMDVWYAQTTLKKHEWNRVVIPIEDISGPYGSQIAKTSKDITGLLFKMGRVDEPNTIDIGTKVYFSSMSACSYPKVDPIPGKIAYFDEAYGPYQFIALNSDVSYSTDYKYQDENGSLKVVIGEGSNGIFGQLTGLIEKDVSEYDYLVLRIYNPNDYEINFLYKVWFGLTKCAPKTWTEIKVSVDEIIKPDTGAELSDGLKDLTWLTFATGKENDIPPAGMTFYLSALYAIKEETPQLQIVPGKIAYFDEEYGTYQLVTINSNVSYSTDYKYQDENGSLKVVISKGNNGIFGQLNNLVEKDVSGYDYLVLRIYNPNDYEITFLFKTWFGLTVCAPKTWTEIKIPVEEIIKPDTGAGLIEGLKDLTWLTLAVGKENETPPDGMTFYLSALYAELKVSDENNDTTANDKTWGNL